MLQKLKEELDSLPENFVVCVITPSEHYNDTNNYLLGHFTGKRKGYCCYVSVNRPYQNLLTHLGKLGMDRASFYFVDCISRKLGAEVENETHSIFIDSPSNLTEIGLALHDFVVNHKQDRKFIYMDSLSTLSIHNNQDTMLKFVHYITGKIRLWNLNGVLISLTEDTDKKILTELNQFCDKIIHTDGLLKE
jgi:hypothetical protein